jgi:flagellar hook-length control protein FliK
MTFGATQVPPESATRRIADPATTATSTSLDSATALAQVSAPAAPLPASAVTTVAAAVAPQQAQATPLAGQVARPLFTLATAAPGEHVLTVNVVPDNLGPVTVRAHVSADQVRVELFAPNDAGRDALRAILPDLRRDLAGTGMNANLDLSSQNQPTDAGGDTPRRGSTPQDTTGTPAERFPASDHERASYLGFGASTLDVMA